MTVDTVLNGIGLALLLWLAIAALRGGPTVISAAGERPRWYAGIIMLAVVGSLAVEAFAVRQFHGILLKIFLLCYAVAVVVRMSAAEPAPRLSSPPA